MKIFTLILLSVALWSCQSQKDKKGEIQSSSETGKTSMEESSLLEEIANANGYSNWPDVETFKYTFNVDAGGNHSERSWEWNPKTDQVSMIIKGSRTTYKRSELTKELKSIDRTFINDKYWLVFPFQLLWDENFNYETKENIEAPISKEKLTEVTVIYSGAVGYTPGDTYKIYLDDAMIIQEWSYIPNGSEKPVLVTTWEDYEDFKGLKLAKNHKTENGNFRLYFTNISVN
jgi:hypothetical protein